MPQAVAGEKDTRLSTDTVLVEIQERIAWVTLNRPEKRNAMNPSLNDDMVRILDTLEDDEFL